MYRRKNIIKYGDNNHKYAHPNKANACDIELKFDIFLEFLTLADVTYRLPRNIGKELPLHGA
jgi:hypothetical protein